MLTEKEFKTVIAIICFAEAIFISTIFAFWIFFTRDESKGKYPKNSKKWLKLMKKKEIFKNE